MSKASEVTVAGEWDYFASENEEMHNNPEAACMWTAGFLSALHTIVLVGRYCSTRGEFGEHMERLRAEAERTLGLARDN